MKKFHFLAIFDLKIWLSIFETPCIDTLVAKDLYEVSSFSVIECVIFSSSSFSLAPLFPHCLFLLLLPPFYPYSQILCTLTFSTECRQTGSVPAVINTQPDSDFLLGWPVLSSRQDGRNHFKVQGRTLRIKGIRDPWGVFIPFRLRAGKFIYRSWLVHCVESSLLSNEMCQ